MTPSSPPAISRARTLSELFAHAGLTSVDGALIPHTHVVALADDSRQVRPGCCFVAVPGVHGDGHDHVGEAVAAGAAVLVIERVLPQYASVPQVVVPDARGAVARLASAYYGLRSTTERAGLEEKPLRLIGITGTNGKTTTAWLLRSMLRAAGRTTTLLGTIEYDLIARRLPAPLTTPGPIELCRHLCAARQVGAEYAVLEVSSHALDQHRCDGLSFAAAVFTNLSGDHLDYHRTMEAYATAKRRLFDLLDDQGAAVLNADDAFGRKLIAELAAPVTSFAMDRCDVDVSARIDALDRTGSRFLLRGRTYQRSVVCSLVGRHNVQNALAAAATAEAIGLSPDAICSGLCDLTGVPGRLQRVEPDGWPFSVLVDYAHSDAALANVLHAVRPLTCGRLICVFGCGGDRDKSKRPRMAAVVEEVADVAYVTSDNPRTEDPNEIIDDIRAGFGPSPRCGVRVETDRRTAIASAIAEACPGDTVLIAGKGHEPYQIVGAAVLPFDDVQVAAECLRMAPVTEAHR